MLVLADKSLAFNPPENIVSRRSFVVGGAGASTLAPVLVPFFPTRALDVDAFVNDQLAGETCNDRVDKKCKPKLSDDEALCRFGFPSKEVGEACQRAGLSTKRAGSTQGLDASGKSDRGDYVRCKQFYANEGGPGTPYVKKTVCDDGRELAR